MATPTTVQFQVTVSSKDENGVVTEKTCLLTLQVESENGEVCDVRVAPVLTGTGTDNSVDTECGTSGAGMPVHDPNPGGGGDTTVVELAY